WCDHIARMWPVTAVIGENGAFYFAYDRQCRKMIREYLHSTSDQEEGRRRLAILREQVIRDVPGCAISADQPFRISDLAIDFREDVEPLSPEAVHSICSLAHNLGLIAKISSIHVNCWFGQFDKITCLKHLLVNHFNQNPDDVQDAMTYIGDSPNDAPAFAHIRHSIAVANIRPFLDTLAHKPRYITRKTSGAGFCEAVETILAMRQVPDITG
ncbi:HAD family hydrolase, partial [bacterium]|nr:HAD family hydrolase [candidate division CSSED10-310 bacterium]